MINLIKKLAANAMLIYLANRYLAYIAQFVGTLVIATSLEPYYLGVWGFCLLIINFFQINNFGFPQATNILIVQHKENSKIVDKIIKTSSALILINILFIVIVVLYDYLYGIDILLKYNIGSILYIICAIASLNYLNRLFVTIYRVRNRLFEIGFFQSVIPFLVLFTIFYSGKKDLVNNLLVSYLVGHLLSTTLFLLKLPVTEKKLDFCGFQAKKIISKGFVLYLHALFFYLIIFSTRTIVSVSYTVEEFGYFIFSYTLANSILLFLEALAFAVFPKIIDKLKNGDGMESLRVINKIRINYITLTNLILYSALALIPVMIVYLPSYSDSIISINLISLTILIYTNSFGFSSYLMAQNEESTIAKVSFISLMLNLALSVALVKYFQVEFEYVILSTMFSYLFYTYMCTYYAKKFLGLYVGIKDTAKDCFPLSLLLPFLLALSLTFINPNLIFFALILFAILNIKKIIEIKNTILIIVKNPKFSNI